MDKKLLFLGVLLGFFCTLVGASTYLFVFTDFNLFIDFQFIVAEHLLGKIIALGSVLNLAVFLMLLKLNKDIIARGLVLATLLTAIATIII